MFSLIVTTVSIALVAALALATLYYGGNAFSEGRTKAQAAKVLNQGQQLTAAATMYRVQYGAWPPTVESLVEKQLLKAIPIANAALSNALAAQPWRMPVGNAPAFFFSVPDVSTCQALNELTQRHSGVLKGVRAEVSAQCYGLSDSTLRLVVVASGDALTRAAQAGVEDLSLSRVYTGELESLLESAWLYSADGATAPVDEGDPVPEPSPAVVASMYEYDFGNVSLGVTKYRSVSFINTSTEETFVGAATVSGDSPFTLMSQTCGVPLAAGDACMATVRFSPSLPGQYSGSLSVSVGQSRVGTVLSGTTPDPADLGQLQTSSTPAGFEGAQIGSSQTQTITFENVGQGPLSFVTLPYLQGSNRFTLASTCVSVLGAGDSCQAVVTFSPDSRDAVQGYLVYQTDVDGTRGLRVFGQGL